MNEPYDRDKPYDGPELRKLGSMIEPARKAPSITTYERIPTHDGHFYAGLVRNGRYIDTTRRRFVGLIWWFTHPKSYFLKP